MREKLLRDNIQKNLLTYQIQDTKEDNRRLPPKFLMRERGKWRRNSFENNIFISVLNRVNRPVETQVWLSGERSEK